jgi:hypothetical protein
MTSLLEATMFNELVHERALGVTIFNERVHERAFEFTMFNEFRHANYAGGCHVQ